MRFLCCLSLDSLKPERVGGPIRRARCRTRYEAVHAMPREVSGRRNIDRAGASAGRQARLGRVAQRSRRKLGMSSTSSSDVERRACLREQRRALDPLSLGRGHARRRQASARSPDRSKPVAITVTRTSSPIDSSMTAPKMMLRVRVGGAGDDLGRLVDLEEAEVAAAGDVEQDAAWRPRRSPRAAAS